MRHQTIIDQITVRRAALLSGLSPYTVDYLCRSGTLVPTGSDTKPGRGKSRYYTFGDVVILRALSHLLTQGLPVSRLREALVALRRRHPEITPTRLPARYLVTDGKQVYFKRKGAIENLNAQGQLAFAFVFELARLRNEVIKTAKDHGLSVGAIAKRL